MNIERTNRCQEYSAFGCLQDSRSLLTGFCVPYSRVVCGKTHLSMTTVTTDRSSAKTSQNLAISSPWNHATFRFPETNSTPNPTLVFCWLEIRFPTGNGFPVYSLLVFAFCDTPCPTRTLRSPKNAAGPEAAINIFRSTTGNKLNHVTQFKYLYSIIVKSIDKSNRCFVQGTHQIWSLETKACWSLHTP